MKPEAFLEALGPIAGEASELRSLELPWPDEPMRHG
jgi:hypothetical protein